MSERPLAETELVAGTVTTGDAVTPLHDVPDGTAYGRLGTPLCGTQRGPDIGDEV